MRVVKRKPKIRARDVLRYLNDNLEILLPLTRKGTYRMQYATLPDWQDYQPASIYLTADKLGRAGQVERIETPRGIIVRITQAGKKRLLQYDLQNLKPVEGEWDGLWRLVFFDIAELARDKRDKLRRYLLNLGMERIQESVFVSPYDVFPQVEYLREVLEVPHGVKLAKLSWIENEREMKELFGL